LAAAAGEDLDGLLELLAPDVTLWTDGGGKVRMAALRPVHGPDKVARMILGFAARSPAGLQVRSAWINGDPAALLLAGDDPVSVLVLDLVPGGHRVRGIYAVANPDKLSRLR
jgi:RNA polymerase sigma-70 factor (ECF subfamily)